MHTIVELYFGIQKNKNVSNGVRINYFRYCLIIVMLLIFVTCYGQKEEQYKGVFVYHFTKYIEWPDTKGDFIIGILGNTPMIKVLENIAKAKKVKNRNIVIKKWSGVNLVGDCHILYVPKSQKNNFSTAKVVIANKNTLLITESPGLAKNGACINFFTRSGKIKFELNKAAIKKQGLKVSPSLVKLAIVVD